MIDWWQDTDHAILECLRTSGPLSPHDLCHRVGLSEGEIAEFLAMLVRQRRVRIRLVELAPQGDGHAGPLPVVDDDVEPSAITAEERS